LLVVVVVSAAVDDTCNNGVGERFKSDDGDE